MSATDPKRTLILIEGGAIAGEGIEPISEAKALAYAKYAGLPPDRFARAGFARETAVG